MTAAAALPRIQLSQPVALLFPGQGVQHPGMGLALSQLEPAAARVMARSEEILQMPVRRLCFEGPEQELRRTENLQPCVLAVSWAAFEVYRQRFSLEEVSAVAGHSLGEIAACAAAGSISWEDALLLVRQRGILMAADGERRPGKMLAIVGLDEEQVERIRLEAAEFGGIWLANLNAPNQFILSGDSEAVDVAKRLAEVAGARRALVLEVPLAAHSPLMARAAAQLKAMVLELPIRAPRIPLVGNGTGKLLRTAKTLRDELTGHLLRPVHWTTTMTTLEGLKVGTVVELGPGRVLASLAAKHMPGVQTWNADELFLDGAC